MKRIILSCFLLVLITITFLSCKKDEDGSEQFDLNVTFEVQSDSTAFTVVYTLDSTSLNNVMGGEIDHVKTLELLEAKYVVTTYSGPAEQQITGTFYVSGEGWTEMMELGTITSQNLSSLVNNEQTLAIQQAGAERFALLVKNSPHSASLTLTGVMGPLSGFGFVISGIFRFKQHKDNPT